MNVKVVKSVFSILIALILILIPSMTLCAWMINTSINVCLIIGSMWTITEILVLTVKTYNEVCSEL